MNTDDVLQDGEDNDADDANPEDVVENVEDDIPSENTNPTSAPDNEAPDGR